MARVKSVFKCTQCGWESAKWMGRCGGCSAWNALVEERVDAAPKGGNDKRSFRLPDSFAAQPEGPGADVLQLRAAKAPIPMSAVVATVADRVPTGMGELDRVLGGGLVPGALILVGGDPGIGKSTLLLQALDRVARGPGRRESLGAGAEVARSTDGGPRGPALYVSGEESPEQVKLRADRLGIASDRLLLFAETRADRIVTAIEQASPCALVIDSIQAVYDPELDSAPGSVSQIREVAARFLYVAKARGIPTFLVGHVTKDGALAGPRVLEHMVDTVLYFESSTGHPFRILRAHKNRFGSTNEIGVFEMQGAGLTEVSNPSELFLAERPQNAPGSVVLAAIEGTRPVLVEVQALVSPSNAPAPRRTCLGFDHHRAALLAAVLEQHVGINILSFDAFVNIAGGMHITEPAADLAVAAAMASSLRNRPIDSRTVVFGEVGLAGELRAVTQPEARVVEAAKLGFSRVVLSEASAKRITSPPLEIVGVKRLEDALAAAIVA